MESFQQKSLFTAKAHLGVHENTATHKTHFKAFLKKME